MQGILNKSSNGVSSSQQQIPPNRQPKTPSRKLIPHFRLPSGIRGLTRWRNKQPNAKKDGRTGGGVRFADEEEPEPKTEDSFDYKDIDFAAEIFDFRVPVETTEVPPRTRKPPRPPPPPPSPKSISKQATANAKTVIFAELPLTHDGELNVGNDNLNNEITMEKIDFIDENVAESNTIQEEEMELGDDLTPEQKLTKFLRDHEGQELSETDVIELEKLLNETDEAEKELDKENVNTCTAQNQTHFDEEVVDEVNLEGRTPKIVEELSIQLETEPTGHTDFSVIEFNKIEVDRSNQNSPIKKGKVIDEGIYEPVGEPILNLQNRLPHKLPDLSGFIVPKASNNIGDPFAWRRRGMRRWDRYGYEKAKNDTFVPSNVQIIDDCQKVEHYIMSRDLSPPGYLLGVLGTNRKLRRKKKKKKAKAVPTVSVVPIHQPLVMEVCDSRDPSSFEDKVTSVILQETFYELKKNLSLKSEEEPSNDMEIVERENLNVKNASPVSMDVDSKPLVNELPETIIESEHNNIAVNFPKNEVVSEIVFENENKIIDNDLRKNDDVDCVHTSRKDAFMKRDRPPRPLPPTPQSIQEFRPIRPSRRPKRVSSAEPPATNLKEEDLSSAANCHQQPFECQTFPRRKETSRRSVSSEEVQRRIQLQAQQFFRTPRKKELQMMSSNSDKSQFPNSSITSYQDSLRRRPRQSRLAPVYTPINKTCQRRKDFASQTSEIFEDEDDRESIPPPPPPKMHHLIKSSECIVCDQQDVEDLSSKIEEDELISPVVTSTVNESPCIKEVSSIDKQTLDSFKEREQQQSFSSIPRNHPCREEFPSIGNLPLMKLSNTDMQLALFCGFLPAGQSFPFNLKDLPEMTVHRLNVDHLEAGFIKVGQVEAVKLIVDQINESVPLNYSKSSIAESSSVNENTVEDLSQAEQQQPTKDSIEVGKINEPAESEASVIDVNGNDSLMSEKGLNWDENSSWSGRIIPSSSSASYVTCDETLHGSITDSEFGTDVEDLDTEEVTTGCSTPTPHDMELETENDYDLLRQVFEAAVANASQNNSQSQ